MAAAGPLPPLPPPPPSRLRPDLLLADKDEEDEEPAEQVEDVDGEEEGFEEGIFKVRTVSDQDRVDPFKTPEESEKKEELWVEGLLKIYYYQLTNTRLNLTVKRCQIAKMSICPQKSAIFS